MGQSKAADTVFLLAISRHTGAKQVSVCLSVLDRKYASFSFSVILSSSFIKPMPKHCVMLMFPITEAIEHKLLPNLHIQYDIVGGKHWWRLLHWLKLQRWSVLFPLFSRYCVSSGNKEVNNAAAEQLKSSYIMLSPCQTFRKDSSLQYRQIIFLWKTVHHVSILLGYLPL